MQAIGQGCRFARAARAEAAEGGAVSANRHGIPD